MGETVLQKSKFDQDVANARTQERGQLDNQALMYTLAAQQAASRPPVLTPQQPPVQMPVLPALVQAGVRLLMQPVILVNTLVQALANLIPMSAGALAQTLAKAEKAVEQIFTFFFGHRKERSEEDKEKRRKNDFLQIDMYGERKVENGSNANLGGGGQ